MYIAGVRFLFWLAQTLIALTWSAALAVWMGAPYVLVGGLVLVACFALLYASARERGEVLDEPVTLTEVAALAGTSFVFGLMWPALPVIIALKAGTDGRDA